MSSAALVLLIGVPLVVVAAVLVVITVVRRSSATPAAYGVPVDDAKRPPGPDLESQVRELLARQRKIEAVKVVRQRTGYGLKDAKDYVDAIERDGRGFRRPPSAPGDTHAEVLELLGRGHKINAIKLVRERTGYGLKDAKDYVEAIERGELPAPPYQGAGDLAARARSYLAAGDRASAIALVRAETGMSDPDATAFVDALGYG